MIDERAPHATSPLRLVAYAAILTALCFAQSPGRIVADTKFDLVAAPGRFLLGGTRLWDSVGAFGQIQNQAGGYLWPMGPFFLLGHLVRMPEWAVQRLWWALLLNLAFFGMLLVLRELRLGRGWPLVAAAAAYVLAPRMTWILGETSVELWPTALAPWVLLPLIRGSTRGSVVRAAALSALAVACCGGVNATAVSAVLPAGVVWILTRSRGPRRWRLLGWWTLFTVLATLWWSVPLALLGRYAAPFLDYIETASVTTSVTDVGNSLLGTSNWTAYFGNGGYPAGASFLSTPFLLLDAAAVAAIGLWGIVAKDHPHRRFAVLTLVVGLVLVGLGYAGEVHGWWALDRRDALDGVLAALRNTHKYDVLIRLALSVGIAHALSVAVEGRWDRRDPARVAGRVLAAVLVVAQLGLAYPWVRGEIAAPRGFTATPSYWTDVAKYLDWQPGLALVVPAAAFGDYTWGSTHDDVLQPLTTGRWAVRNVIPLAQPGNVAWMDDVTRRLESGRPDPGLAKVLADAGVSTLVVRNDLERFITGAPDPAYVHAVLDSSPGLSRAATYGPLVGSPAQARAPDGTAVLRSNGLSGAYHSVEIYHVDDYTRDGTRMARTTSVMGDPGTGLQLTGDVPNGAAQDVVLTDGLRRQETDFTGVRHNLAATAPAGSAALLPGAEQFHRIFPDQARWQTTEQWSGVRYVSASGSQSDANAGIPIVPGDLPMAAVDGDRRTAWMSPRNGAVDGSWLEVGLPRSRSLDEVTIILAPGSAHVSRLRVSAGTVTRVVDAPDPGHPLTVDLGAQRADTVRVTALAPSDEHGSWGIATLSAPGLHAQRVLALPTPPDGSTVDQIRLTRDPGTAACPSVRGTVTCEAFLGTNGEDGDRITRQVRLTSPERFAVSGTASLRRRPGVSAALARAAGVSLRVTGDAAIELADSPVAMLDHDPGTTWRAEEGATIELGFGQPRRVRSVSLITSPGAAAAAPVRVQVRAGGHTLTGRLEDGRIAIPDWSTRRLSIKILATTRVDTFDGTTARPLGPGVSELRIDDRPVVPDTLHLACGEGPTLWFGGSRVQTGLDGSLGALVRGRSVPLRVCGQTSADLSAGANPIHASRSILARADSLTLTRSGASLATLTATSTFDVRRDTHQDPTSAHLDASPADTVISLPQNFNAGWRATLEGRVLTPQRVDGWKQGWVVPAGRSGTVHFSYPPQTTYVAALVVGLVALLLVGLVAVVASGRRRTLPALGSAPAGLLDVVVLGLALGLLGGWPALGIGVVLALWRRWLPLAPGSAIVAGLMMLAVLPRVSTSLAARSEVVTAAHWCALAAAAVVSASVLADAAGRLRFLRRRKGSSKHR